ncbi:unnamed protein product [Rangifer tarandus platyrhynchus]|uniref:Uncharacterized protein n=1 Tax=Rangifer tarandus platyrhynchus TaxID=3082113 RepID=A0ABN8XVY9_RANTA|nr:unnamed protein product [Rangifer tarandus platyrhynchus]
MKVRFEGVIPMVGGLGRRQDSRGRTAKPSGALSQDESHLTLPGSTKHLTRGVGGGGWGWGGDRWLWQMTGGFKGWDKVEATGKEIRRRRMPCTSGHLGGGGALEWNLGGSRIQRKQPQGLAVVPACSGFFLNKLEQHSNNFHSKFLSLGVAHATSAPSQAPRSTWRSPAGSP